MSTFDDLKQKYKEGYRCIYSEKDSENGLKLHLKNFFSEKIDEVSTKNDMEIGQIEGFLQDLDKIKKKSGHDCCGTE